jgi:acetate kinase
MSHILTLNAGSSSIKFAVYSRAGGVGQVMAGQVVDLGPKAELQLAGQTHAIGAADHNRAVTVILEAIAPALAGAEVTAVGHRIVHGGTVFSAPAIIDAAALDTLDGLVPLAPSHEPHNIAAIRAAMASFPDALQVGCFDTAFHAQQSFVESAYGLPRRYHDEGIRRYGFHGLSYAYIATVLQKDHPALHQGRVIVAHLGNGASMCAMRDGRSIGCSMGFSALDGLIMGTRVGQVDPGVLLYLLDQGMTPAALSDLLYKESGLKGLSGLTNDMRALLASDDPNAAEAVACYTYRARREIGAMAAMLGGLDGLVFTGGVGENAAAIRAGIAEGLGFVGVTLDAAANTAGATRIGTGAVEVLVIPTDEEGVIARATDAILRAR